jgi:hypothetical protein
MYVFSWVLECEEKCSEKMVFSMNRNLPVGHFARTKFTTIMVERVLVDRES